MSWSVMNLIFLLLSRFSRLLLSILISLASPLWNPDVYMYAIKELISPPRHWCSLIQIYLLCPNYISSVIFKVLLSAVLSIAYTASPASLCPLILFFCQNAQSNMDFRVWGFFPSKAKQSSKNHCNISEIISPVVLLGGVTKGSESFTVCRLWFFAFYWECRGRIFPACFLHTWKGWHCTWCSWDSDRLTFLVVSLWCFWNNAQGVWQLCGDSVMQADLKQNCLAVWNSQMVLGNFWDSRNPGKQWSPVNSLL